MLCWNFVSALCYLFGLVFLYLFWIFYFLFSYSNFITLGYNKISHAKLKNLLHSTYGYLGNKNIVSSFGPNLIEYGLSACWVTDETLNYTGGLVLKSPDKFSHL